MPSQEVIDTAWGWGIAMCVFTWLTVLILTAMYCAKKWSRY